MDSTADGRIYLNNEKKGGTNHIKSHIINVPSNFYFLDVNF